jgi:hypothetical protein
MNSNLEKLNPQEIGKTVEKTTNYLKKLSDYIENKLYDSEGNTKQGGVKSLSLTFAMLVGFSLAILVVSSIHHLTPPKKNIKINKKYKQNRIRKGSSPHPCR